MSRSFFAAASMVALAAANSHAARADAAAVEAAADIPVIVVIGEASNLADIAGSGGVVERAEIDRIAPISVNDVLRTIPGVFAREEEGIGLRPNIGIRGLNPIRSTKVLLLEDGIPTTYAPYGDQASYYHPPIGRFERVEVLKGASQVRFGPQTIGGVINYVTPDAPEAFGGRAVLSIGDRGWAEGDLTLGGPALGGRLLAHANAKQSDGARDNQELRYTDLYLKGEWDLAPAHDLVLRLNRFAEDSQVTYSGLTLAEYLADPYQNPFVNDAFETERYGGSASHGWRVSDAVQLTTTGYLQTFDRAWWRQSSNSGQRPYDASDPACGGMANLSTTCGNEGRVRQYESYGIESRLDLAHDLGGLPTATELGLRWHREHQDRLQLNGDTPTARTPGVGVNAGVREDNERVAEAWSGFVRSEIDLGSVTVSPGVRYETIAYERTNNLTGVSGETEFDIWVPGIGVVWDAAEDWSIYGGVHKGFAPARVEDVISNTTGGALELDPEESVNLELGVRGAPAPGVALDVTAFSMTFENQIVPASVAGGAGATLTSAGETLHQGIEASVDASLRDAGVLGTDDVRLRAAVTWLPTAEFEGARFSNVSGFGTTSVTGNRLPYAPEWLATAAVTYDWSDRVETHVEVVYTGGMFTDDLNTIEVSANGQRGRIKSATTWNLGASADVPGTEAEVFLAVKNVFDETYVVDRARGTIPGAPRSTQVGVRVAF